MVVICDVFRFKDVIVLKFFLGLIMFYLWFMLYYFIIFVFLYNLLKKDILWKWFKVEEDVFVVVKDLILNL